MQNHRPPPRTCKHCRKSIPKGDREDKVWCSDRCKQAAYRERKEQAEAA
jgi:predicted nucleic acid-binding Zn ribbon protein